jgi:hypothetical protein
MIYVDQLRYWRTEYIKPAARRYGHDWCHLVTDGDIEELHAFAERIGCPRFWFQEHPRLSHYDLTPRKRQAAIEAGAIAVPSLMPVFEKIWAREKGINNGTE